MNYAFFKFKFRTAVHFGGGTLNSTNSCFLADTLFSALYLEAMKLNLHEKLYSLVSGSQLCFSDSFPYMGGVYYLPKPMKNIENSKQGDSKEKKLLKKIKYLPCDKIDDFLKSRLDLMALAHKFCDFSEDTKVTIRQEEAIQGPYRVGVCTFLDNCGLYVIVGYENQEAFELAKVLFEALQYSGIGGKRTSGYGKFAVEIDTKSEAVKKLIERNSDMYMTLAVSLPEAEELSSAIAGSSYLLIKRSGFVMSDNYAREQRRKQDRFVFAAGSCFTSRFKGGILNVAGDDGLHPVYRYAVPMFIGV